MNSCIFSIGEELLEGSIADTNSSFIAQALSEFGAAPEKITILPDEADTIARALAEAAKRYTIIIISGGLGPTFDDVTIEAAAKAFALKLVRSDEAMRHIKGRLASRGIAMTPSQERQALFPEGGSVIINPAGTAPAVRLEIGEALLFFLPGVPAEMTYIMTNIVMPHIEEHFSLKKIYKRDLFFRGMPESCGDQAIKKIGIPVGVNCIINVFPNRRTAIRVRADTEAAAAPFIRMLLSELNGYYAGDTLKSGAQELSEVLFEKKLSFATAESCTGGLAASKLTEISGISEVFKGGAVSYTNGVKHSLLGVSPEILARYSAVSKEVALEMVLGVKKLMDADAALSVTGYAGGSSPADENTGKIFIAAAFDERAVCEEHRFSGSRNEIRESAAESALQLARRLINGEI
ncbi:MAG: CinA family nicotinamide mononucleotide deamidase-related protein [Deferribacteraceae bacterium]|jgi:nicotinamide-nucleotide amidase|nr:CinA family nicotinamide mononucleotide deamidase-related protein [Deferribacteraceae bacterium]